MLTILSAALLASGFASPRAAIDAYGAAVSANDPVVLSAAFQPSAMMYCTNKEGLSATSQAEWKARMNATVLSNGSTTTTVAWLDEGATTAIARVAATRSDQRYTDYLLLARLKDGWRIVGKVCEAQAPPDPLSDKHVEKVVTTKLDADRTWDDSLLADSIDQRALVMTVDAGEFVAASVGEWQARYRDRRQKSSASPGSTTSLVVDAQRDIGAARWSFRGSDGREWTDRALVVRTATGWRMMALAFAKEPPTPREDAQRAPIE